MIQVKQITMDYGPVRALDSVSFEAAQGQILGLLGPNGAGKTTAMNIIAGHLFPVSGTVTVGGHDVLENPVEVEIQRAHQAALTVGKRLLIVP